MAFFEGPFNIGINDAIPRTSGPKASSLSTPILKPKEISNGDKRIT